VQLGQAKTPLDFTTNCVHAALCMAYRLRDADGMQAREKGIDTPSSRLQQQQRQQQSEGLGRVGPLRFRNSTKKAREASSAAAAAEGDKAQDDSSAAAGKQ
jgi:hypothetical protein